MDNSLPSPTVGRRCVFDVEGDGLLYAQGAIKQVTQFWCIGAIDIDTKEEFYWGVDKDEWCSRCGGSGFTGPETGYGGVCSECGGQTRKTKDSLEEGLRFLAECSLLVGHNAIGYDFPACERLYPWWKRPAKAWDSMVMAKARWPAEALIDGDMKLIHRGKMPPQYLKRHSLKAWGMRTGTYKTDYKGGFDAWNAEMAEYLMDDCRATVALWDLIQLRAGDWPEQVWVVENGVARIIHEQWETGVNFDHDKAVSLAAGLRNEQARLERVLVETFGSWWEAGDVHTIPSTRNEKMPEYPDVTIPRYGKTGKALAPYVGPPLNEFQEGHQYTPIKRITFSPSNRFHLGDRLQVLYGWKPKAFGANGAAQVDETTLTEIPEAILPADIRQMILDYFVVSKTYAMVATGRKSWMKCVNSEDGRVHGRMDTIGAVTRRATHMDPNLSQTPAVLMEKVKDESGNTSEHPLHGLSGKFGWECRELFRADDGWEQTGVDASSLELILLGHYLWRFDEGAFSARVCDKTRDAHREHGDLAGITRADAKTLIYLKIYGGSAWKHSLDLDPLPLEDVPQWLGSKSLPGLLKALERRMGQEFVDALGDAQKARLAKARDNIIKMEKGITGLKDLIDDVAEIAASKGFLKGLDGSRITVRKSHAGLNSLLQSAGAMVCKQWMILLHEALEAKGLKKGRDWKQILWSHDEFQMTHVPGLGPSIKALAEETIVVTGEMLGLRGRFRSDGKTGENWAQCH